MHLIPLTSTPWRFRDQTAQSPWRPAVVPGCVHRDLLRHRLIPDPFWGNNEAGLQWIDEHGWEYRTTVILPAAVFDEESVDLVADGLDTVATITVNGRVVARTENMFTGYRWNVKKHLRAGKNEILIRFDSSMDYIRKHRTSHVPRQFNDPVGRCQVIRKEQCQFGWDWGPRFITAGIWRDIRLEAWSTNRLGNVRVTQTHTTAGSVKLTLAPEFARTERRPLLRWRLTLGEQLVGEGTGTEIPVAHPQLWWPAGQGAQPLYDLQVEAARADGAALGGWRRRIGLRTIVWDRHPDEWGESFQFVVNGRAIFAKGANWIPAHSFAGGLTRADYERDLRSAVEVHMNMIRVWGGGIYESEDFYDLCDELGLLVWQDFMFACSFYPADRAFLRNVRKEAEYQVGRLRHRACLALWCGNNEISWINVDLMEAPKNRAGYDKLFKQVLPEAVTRCDGVTGYWPSSPYRGDDDYTNETGTRRGDTHSWDVWHKREPVKDYERWAFRFVSEFGMQSYSSPETNASFCPPDDANILGPTMENHQKNRAGNQIILDYVSRRYRAPKGQDELIYLSQLNQAYCMQVAVEHWRRNMPRCMGALYWQLNDCWPVASWSSIEFSGRWRILHHAARRFFAPALVSVHVPGDEIAIIGNYRRSTVREAHLYTVYDAPEAAKGTLAWALCHVDGRTVLSGRKRVSLRYGQSVKQKTLDLAGSMAAHGREYLYLRVHLTIDGVRVSQQTVFLTPPRFVALPAGKVRTSVRLLSPQQAVLKFRSPVFQHALGFELPGLEHVASDNYFDLHPDEAREVTVTFQRPCSSASISARLKHRSLVDTYSANAAPQS